MGGLVLLLCGFAGGILGGMGMGGGTALIPLLTLFCGIAQQTAQGVNLLSFLPMSLVAIGIHAKNGLIRGEGLVWLVAPALVFSVAFSFAAAYLPSAALKKGFGVFLIVLSVLRFAGALRRRKGEHGARFLREKV